MQAVRILVIMLAGATGSASADLWTEPDPQRSEALLDGRDFTYGTLAFLHRLSYRHLSDAPPTDRDGVRGTAGSVSGDELFVDIHLQKTLEFDDGRHGVFLRMQRFEDFDGRFDRQIVGIQRRLGDHWTLALAGDVKGSKADTDVQLEARWRPDDERMLRFMYIRPELFFNDKGGTTAEYTREPATWFVHYRQASPDGAALEIAANLSPRARLEIPDQQLTASGRQTRVMVRGHTPLGAFGRDDLVAGTRAEFENSRRSFDWAEAPTPAADAFRRRMYSGEVFVALAERRLAARAGYRWLRLREDGWFGNALATSGFTRRDEHTIYASARIPSGARHHFEPAIYLSRIDQQRRFDLRPTEDRDRSQWASKLALPWRYTVSEADGAVLTINLTARLHTMTFGGGNVQLHWPL